MYVFGSVRGVMCEAEWVRGLVSGFTNPAGTGGMRDVCLCLG